MSNTPSNMLPLGTMAPNFLLPDTVSQDKLNLSDLQGEEGTLILFICNHCPFVIHVIEEVSRIAKEYQRKGIKTIAISSNDIVNYPQDAPAHMSKFADKFDFSFPYLFDETQEVAKAYQAACTPDFFLFDNTLKLVYRGQLDGSRPGNGIPVTGKDLKHAMDQLLKGAQIPAEQKPSMGCNIKWKK
ncbi:thioredoxin family protein [Sediminicola sp. 1XM1-17]|uniref:thioredoxin family protein n=1 Tax=Sediminicola sp. 1XM1-17 TaxID=3127702 RepID=UPI0030770BBB